VKLYGEFLKKSTPLRHFIWKNFPEKTFFGSVGNRLGFIYRKQTPSAFGLKGSAFEIFTGLSGLFAASAAVAQI
jgi:hypothetical protein